MIWLRRKLVRWIDDIYFAGVKDHSTQFRDDMLEAFTAGQKYESSIFYEADIWDRQSRHWDNEYLGNFNQWFKDNYL